VLAGAGLDVLGKRYFCCSCQDLNRGSFSVYSSHCTDCAGTYCFEGNTKVRINDMRLEVWIGCV
jgi:hypothetical protein